MRVDFVIRKITETEYPGFSPISDQIARLCFSRNNGILLLAENQSGCPVGYIAAYANEYVADVSYIFVRPLFRGNGVAKKSYETVDGHCRKAGFHQCD